MADPFPMPWGIHNRAMDYVESAGEMLNVL
jgi:hypothetical protein